METINEKTIERLCVYRRLLNRLDQEGVVYTYSHDLAAIANVSSVQVRRDLMNIGYTGNNRKGYEIKQVLININGILDAKQVLKLAIVGVGNLGKAMVNFFAGKNKKVEIAALFDVDPDLVGTTINDIPCYPVEKLREVLVSEKILIGVIASSNRSAKKVADEMVSAGVKSIVNFTNTPLSVKENVFLEQVDISTSIEKAAYFAKMIEAETETGNKKKNVLVIDDDVDIASTYKTIIESRGFSVEVALSATEGMEKLAANQPDAIVLDIMMEKPDSGFLFLNELKEKQINIPVILCSSIAKATANILDVNQLNIRTILQKPVDLDDLMTQIDNCLV